LAESSEIYWIIKGNGTLFINGTAVELKKGRAVLVPPSAEQYVVNSGDEILEFLCMVSPPWELSDECIL
jgi:mannose-6-phosphate isomerase-like protein (cupin superfamily)